MFKKALGAEKNLLYYSRFMRCSLAGVTHDKYCKYSVQNDLWCVTWTLGRNGTVMNVQIDEKGVNYLNITGTGEIEEQDIRDLK